jgi:hypothetical protein
MSRPTRALLALTSLQFALAGCATQPTDSDTGGFAMEVGALNAACGGQANKNPFTDIKTFKLVVREPQSNGTLKILDIPTPTVAVNSTSVTFKEVPARQKLEVTLLGFAAGASSPTWFARRSGVNVPKTTTTTLDLTLMAVEGFTCLPNPSTGPAPNVAFSVATRIANGKVLITGGFSSASPSTDGKTLDLTNPRDVAYIFDPATGKLDQVAGQMINKRGGHSAIYLPKANQVLIVGGAQTMHVPADGSGPPSWKPEEGTNNAFEIFDVTSGKFLKGKGDSEFGHRRVLPTLMPLANDLVAVLGGAPWPLSDDPVYRYADLYDPNAGDATTGGYVDPKGQLALVGARAGSALAYIGPTSNGTSRYLIWGGNVLVSRQFQNPGGGTVKNGFDPGPMAERFKESTISGVGEFNADFSIEGDFKVGPDVPPLFFPTLTAIGPARDEAGKPLDDGRFLSVGGVRFDKNTQKWLPADPGDVFLLTLKEATEQTKGRISTKRIQGLSAGLYMHQASEVGTNVLVSGGFSAYNQPASFTMQAFEIGTQAWKPANALPAAASFIKRGAHASLQLSNDCLLMYGGVAAFADLQQNGVAVPADVYCPKLLVP